MAKTPTVKITGLDATLIRIEGKFSSELDKKVLNLQGSFIKQMDKAASRLFEAMGKDISVGGNVARRVMGSHAKTPSFLVQQGARWEPLSEPYLLRKKRMMRQGKIKTAYFWQYTGSMVKVFRAQSEKMVRISNNTSRYASVEKNGVREAVFKPKPKDPLFLPLKNAPAQGKNIGTRGKNYDFIYDENLGVQINYGANHKKQGAVPEKYVRQMNRRMDFSVFNGYAAYVNDMMEGRPPKSPESYFYSFNSKQVFDENRGEFRTKGALGIKLFYHRNGVLKKRDLISPYMRYYFKTVMLPLAQKTIYGMTKK